jgi:P pilus assembly chaperone PapD
VTRTVAPRLSGRARKRASRAGRRAWQVALSAAMLVLTFSGGAAAQIAVDRMELVLQPHVPDRQIGVFSVKNNGGVPLQATVALADWDRDETGANRFFPAGVNAGSCGGALRVSPATMRLEPGTSQDVRVSVERGTAASEATAGRECWQIVFVETTLPPVPGAQRAVAYVLRTGVKLYVAPGGLDLGGEITDMRVRARTTADGAAVSDSSAGELELTFHNSGSLHSVAQGSVELRRADNSVAATLPIPELNTLPGSSRRVSVALPHLPPGRYVVLAILDFKGNELAAAQLEHEVR